MFPKFTVSSAFRPRMMRDQSAALRRGSRPSGRTVSLAALQRHLIRGRGPGLRRARSQGGSRGGGIWRRSETDDGTSDGAGVTRWIQGGGDPGAEFAASCGRVVGQISVRRGRRGEKGLGRIFVGQPNLPEPGPNEVWLLWFPPVASTLVFSVRNPVCPANLSTVCAGHVEIASRGKYLQIRLKVRGLRALSSEGSPRFRRISEESVRRKRSCLGYSCPLKLLSTGGLSMMRFGTARLLSCNEFLFV